MANRNNSKEDRKPEFLEALKKSRAIIQPALDAIRIDRQTYLNWYKKDPEFARAVDEINEMQIDVVENKLQKRIDNDDTTAIIFYLKTKGKNRGYIERREVEATVDGKLEQRNPLLNMPFEELKKLYESIQKKKSTTRRKTAKTNAKKR